MSVANAWDFFYRSTFVRSMWSFVFFIPATTANDLRLRRISDFIHYIYFPILILEKEPVFPFLMFSAKQGNYLNHFITSLVWRGPWLGIEPETSRTRSQHSTTRLSRRWLGASVFLLMISAQKGNTGTSFITSLLCRGPSSVSEFVSFKACVN